MGQEFDEQLFSKETYPCTLLHFYFPNKVVYLSDTRLYVNGIEYEPLVESFGTLNDNSSITHLLSSGSLEARTMKVNIILNRAHPSYFYFSEIGLEEVTVDVFQWFRNIPDEEMELIDTFVCQAPIEFKEASSTVSIDLVSIIMKDNPYLTGEGDQIRYPVVLGKYPGVPLISMNSARVTTLAGVINSTDVGTLLVLNAVGFETSGNLIVDTEIMSFNSRTDTTFNITARGVNGTTAQSHNAGQNINNPESHFDYYVAAGPVDEILDVVKDNALYPNDYQVFPNAHPAMVRFPVRPPFWQSTLIPGGPIPQPDATITDYGADHENYAIDGAVPVNSPGNINTPSSEVSLSIENIVSHTLTHSYSFPNRVGYSNRATIYRESASQYWYGTDAVGVGVIDFFTSVTFDALGDLSHLGEFVSASIEFNHPNNYVTRSEYQFRIILELDGTDATIYDSFVGALDSSNVKAPWSNTKFNYGPIAGVNSWGDLELLKIRTRLNGLNNTDPGTLANLGWVQSNGEPRLKVSFKSESVTIQSPAQSVYSWFVNHGSGSLGTFVSAQAIVKVSTSINTAIVDRKIMHRVTANPGDDNILWSDTVNATSGYTEIVVSLPINSWAELANSRVGFGQTVVGPTDDGTNRRVTSLIQHIKWLITYTPPDGVEPDETVIVFVDELTCTVIGKSGDPVTPPEIIYKVLEANGFSDHVDLSRYQDEIAEYTNQGYFIRGLYDKDIKLHDFIKSVARQGLGRLNYTQGFIDYIGYRRNPSHDHDFSTDDIKLKSIVEKQGSEGSIYNRIIVKYNYENISGNFLATKIKEDGDSILRYGIKEKVLETPLIYSEDIAEIVAEFFINIYSTSSPIIEITTFMSGYRVIKTQTIGFETEFNNYIAGVGWALSKKREFGQGKSGKINTFTISVYKPYSIARRPEMYDTLHLDETFLIDNGRKVGEISELNLVEFLTLAAGYGTGGYGHKSYGA